MQHPLQISRKIEYGLRAMTFLAAIEARDPGGMVPLGEIAKRMSIPQDFAAKILKTLTQKKLVRSTRGARGGYALGKPPKQITFLDVIEAVEGPVVVNVCQEHAGADSGSHAACQVSSACTMYSVWKWGQQRMLDVYRSVTLDQIAMKDLRKAHPALRLKALPGALPAANG